MNLKNLRAFIAIADAGGVHRAAARLNLTQPAMSRQIHALESELGVQLFDRIGRRVQLSSEGKDLLRRGRQLMADVGAFTERAVALKKGDTGILRVGATPQVIETTLVPFLAGYRRRHPAVEVQLVEDGGVRLQARLGDGDVQLAFTTAANERMGRRPLYPVFDVAVLAKDHRLHRHRSLEVAQLSDEPLLLLHRGFGSREWLDKACEDAGIQPRVLLESGAPHTIMALAGSGYGVAVVPSTVQINMARVRAVPLTQRGATLGRWLTVAWDARRFVALSAERFVDEMVTYCQRHFPGRQLTRHIPPVPRPE